MRSPQERALWTVLAVIVVAGAAAAWWTADRWLPHAGPWLDQAWLRITRPGPDTLPPGQRAAAPRAGAAGPGAAPAPVQPRKCVRDGQVIYTDQPCPAGAQELPVDGGAVTTLPR